MKKVLLLLVASALLVTLGLAQTPDAASNTDPANIKGCLGGSDGNYTIAEDGSRQMFKITTSSVDLKPHLGHDVKLTGHKAIAPVNSGSTDNSFAVTELSMISEHCALAAAAPAAATVIPPSETVITPAADADGCTQCGCQRTRGRACRARCGSKPSFSDGHHARRGACSARSDGQPVFSDCQHAPCGTCRAGCGSQPSFSDGQHTRRRACSARSNGSSLFRGRQHSRGRASGACCDSWHVFSDRQHGRRRTSSPDETVSPRSQTRGSASCSRVHRQSFGGGCQSARSRSRNPGSDCQTIFGHGQPGPGRRRHRRLFPGDYPRA